MPEMRYIVGGSDGWLRVKQEPSGEIISVPEHLQVEWTSSGTGRDHFTVMEGVHRGKKFSVTAGNLNPRRPEYKGAAHLTFSLGQRTLTYPLGSVKAITQVDNALPAGTHPIQIPDHPHDGGLYYIGQTPYAKSWFYLGHGEAVLNRGDRYLHPGSGSLGCITVDPSGGLNCTDTSFFAGAEMARPWVVSLWCASVLVVAPATAGGSPRLTQEQIGQPDEVVAWLKQNEALADKKIAQMAYDQGLRKKKRKDWGGAAKAFAESAIHYPTPAALTEYAENSLRMFGDIRQRNRAYAEHWRRDLGRAEAGYRTALAADAVIKQLNEQERRRTEQHAGCLAEYLKTSVKPHNCPPLGMYGLEK